MRQHELIEKVQSYNPGADEALLNRAYVFAMRAHGNQKRASGAPYITHPLEVAAILAEMRLDDATIAAALLHDTIEDTGATRAEIDRTFGEKIGALVEGLTKLNELDLVTKKAEQAENFRKLLLAISTDIRVLLVKLADRLHNMRTLEHVRPEKQVRISEETLEIYAPLAGRMGMQALREELEDLAFRWRYPEAFESITKRLAALRDRNAGLTDEIRSVLVEMLERHDIQAEVFGREKRGYSIWRKMEKKQIAVEQLSDIYGFRIIVPSVTDCYRVLGVAHTTWPLVPGRFKDYISTPKQNDYRSIHTTVVGPRHQRVELQIRTREMHEVAEYGVAAHSIYKDAVAPNPPALAEAAVNGIAVNGAAVMNGSGEGTEENISNGTPGSNGAASAGLRVHSDSKAYRWLRRLVDDLLGGDNAEEFLEHTKLELFHDQVFCFTPKGELIALPRGATPIDFAYAVHTDVGNSCVGCKINRRPVPLMTELRNGDEVEIVRSEVQSPPAAWERIAVTGKARSAIRRAARDLLRKQYTELGHRLLEGSFSRFGETYDAGRLKNNLHRLGRRSVEDLLVAVGRGEMQTDEVVRAVHPDAKPPKSGPVAWMPRNRQRPRSEEGWFSLGKLGLLFRLPGSSAATASESPARSIPIRGAHADLPVEFAEGGAVPGDRIVGILTPNHGIKIYPISSPQLKSFDNQPERWIDVTWNVDEKHPERFPATIDVTAKNEPGTLAEIANLIGNNDGNIDTVEMRSRAADYTVMRIGLEVWNLQHLTRIISGLKARGALSKVERVFS